MIEGLDTTKASEVHCVNMRPLAFRRLYEYLTSELSWENISTTLELEPGAVLLKSINEVFSVTLLFKDKYVQFADVIAFFARELRILYIFTRDY